MKPKKPVAAMRARVNMAPPMVCAGSDTAGAMAGQRIEGASGGYSLVFDPAGYTVKTLTLGESTISYRAYENIVYVKYPVDLNYQVMNIYVPEGYYRGRSIGVYTAETAPLFLPNMVGGYLPGPPGSPGRDRNGNPNAALTALSKGYVVAQPGVRGRTTRDKNGLYTGTAPACIVDLKAAVRYLRSNDRGMPGDAEKIISNGTSAGGALSALLGATGNNREYEPYLRALGAADARDDIFAVSSYCPITSLDTADMAYEWLFNGINGYTGVMLPGPMPSGRPKFPEIKGTMTTDQIRLSGELKQLFPAYLNGLGLTAGDGTALTLDASGNGSFKAHVRCFMIASAQTALNSGRDLSGLTWITVRDGTVTEIDFDGYVRYANRMKATPAFDGWDLKTGENELFGTATMKARHFTRFGREQSTARGTLAEASIVRMMNPMNYIGAEGSSTSRYWRIRHGAVDRDTSLAIPVILATRLENRGFDVDFAMPWGRGHGGDYDQDELFSWIDAICAPRQGERQDVRKNS